MGNGSSTPAGLIRTGCSARVYKEGHEAVKVMRCACLEDRMLALAEYELMVSGSRRSSSIMPALSLRLDEAAQAAEIRMPRGEGSALDYLVHWQQQQQQQGRQQGQQGRQHGRQKGLPEKQVLQVAKQALEGLRVLHDMGMAHGNIKPQHLILMEYPTNTTTSPLETVVAAATAMGPTVGPTMGPTEALGPRLSGGGPRQAEAGPGDIAEGTVKLSGFGSSFRFGAGLGVGVGVELPKWGVGSSSGSSPWAVPSSPRFVAPELMELVKPAEGGKETQNVVESAQKSDLWSLGNTLLALIIGHIPCSPEDYSRDSEQWAGIHSETKSLVAALLAANPERRPSVHTCLSLLGSHPLLSKQGDACTPHLGGLHIETRTSSVEILKEFQRAQARDSYQKLVHDPLSL